MPRSRQKFGSSGIALRGYQAERGLLLVGRQARKPALGQRSDGIAGTVRAPGTGTLGAAPSPEFRPEVINRTAARRFPDHEGFSMPEEREREPAMLRGAFHDVARSGIGG